MSREKAECIRHVVILAHPSRHSFNAAVAAAYCETVRECGQTVILRDLYAMGFDPLLKEGERPREGGVALSEDVRTELAMIRNADIYVLVYPIWFAMPPAMLKGYLDRVLGAAVMARQIQDHSADGVLTGRRLLSITTSGSSEVWLHEQGQIGSLRNLTTRYLRNAFEMTSCAQLHLGGISEDMTERVAATHLSEVREQAKQICATLAADRYNGQRAQVLARFHE